MQIFGIKIPDIKLPKLDLSPVLAKGVEVLKQVAGDMFAPSKDGKTLFNKELEYKTNFFDIKLKNPVEMLAEKLLGKVSEKIGLDPNALGSALGGVLGGQRDVKDVGEDVELPALQERAKALSTKTTTPEVGGGEAVAAPATTTPATTSKVAPGADTDFASAALDKFGGTLSGLDRDINAMLAKGADLSQTDTIKLQMQMQKRSELFQMLTQIMNLEHETKRQIIGNIR